MKSAIFTLLASASIFGAIPQVQAWGVLGHRTIGLLAQDYLLPSTVKKVQAILGGTQPPPPLPPFPPLPTCPL